MKLQTVLFDLDDTLLNTNTETFIENYFALLYSFIPNQFDQDKVFEAVRLATRIMIQDTNQHTTNREVFWQAFTQHCGVEAEEIEPIFVTFYQDVFPQLQKVTAQRPSAPDILTYCFQQGWQVVVATNPVFPLTAIEHRLTWAGTPTTLFDFALVTHYENMNTTKPHLHYYQQIMEVVRANPKSTLMVGDSWENDIQPAHRLGLRTYWICEDGDSPPDATMADGFGTVAQLYQQLQTGKFPKKS